VGADGAAPAALWTAVLTWSRLHGVISLEMGGNFGSMGIDAASLYGGAAETSQESSCQAATALGTGKATVSEYVWPV
jgi:Tetracyclin repressor-like, C-terminal domain